jgi:uncharacterized repeat protein (TIGR01451 family)
MLSLAVTGSAFGLDAKVSCGNTAYFVSNDEMAQCVFPGDEIYYIVSVGLGANDYPIINGVVTFTTPDGASYTLDTNLSLGTGDTQYYDVRVDADGWENYIVNCEDGSSTSQCTALSVLGTGYASVTGTGTWDLYCKIPCIDVTKTADTDISKVGDTVNYEICVTNCSTGNDILCNLALSNIQVVDTILGTITFDPPISELAVGESRCVTVSREVQEGDPDPLVNTVTASGEMYDPGAVDTPVVVTDEDSASVNLVQPDFTVEKECPPVSKVGDEVCYTVTITNTGTDADLAILSVEDSLVGSLSDCVGVILAPGESCIDDYCYTVQEGDPDPLVNNVTVLVGVVGLTNTIEKTSEDCETDLVHPSIEIVKECDPQTAAVGDVITYTITITNTSDDIALENIVVTDSLLGDLSASFVDTLEPGASDTQQFTRNIEDTDPSPLPNTATVHANPVGLENDITDDNSCEVTIGGNTFCSVTQGYWGNAGGKKCGGQTTTQLLNALLGLGGPVVVGLPGHSITFNTAACIIDRLPAGGTPAVLPAGDYNCASLPNSLAKKNKPEINNVLVGQVVTLSLNVRLGALPCLSIDEPDGLLGTFVIPEGPFCTVAVGDEDGDITQVEIDDAFAGWTVNELLALANEALGGANISPYKLSQINNAVTAINEGFDGCRTVVACPEEDLID